MGAFSLDKSDGIAIITFDLPDEPVNKFSAPVRDELIKLFDNVRDDPSVSAVAFCSGKADVFIAGADVDEFVALKSKKEAQLLSSGGQEMIGRVASFPKRWTRQPCGSQLVTGWRTPRFYVRSRRERRHLSHEPGRHIDHSGHQ